MILPDKWGQGAIFSYSGAEGICKCEGGIDAQLCGDSFSLLFHSESKCMLRIIAENAKDLYFETVMPDYISAKLRISDREYSVKLIFAAMNTVLISADCPIEVQLEFDHSFSVKKSKKCDVYTAGKESFALACKKEGNCTNYAFLYGKGSAEKAADALSLSIDDEEADKLHIYESFPELRIPNESLEKLYYRCAGILLASIRSPEGLIGSAYISPQSGIKTGAYAFESAICTLGLRHLSPTLARETLEALLAAQSADGMVSGKLYHNKKSSEINPPVLAWCFWELYQVNEDKGMLENAYNALKKYLHYILESRDINKNYLFEWQVADGTEEYGNESMMDNSPRFDDNVILDSIDFSSYMANEAKCMSLIAEEIDKHGEGLYWDVVFERIKNAVNEILFDEDDKVYYDRAVVSNMFKKVKSGASFLPLFAGICENRHAMAMLRLLNNEEKFNLKYGIPSVARDSADYSNDYWRGPAHMYLNYFVAKGLENYEMHDKANEIKSKTLYAVLDSFENDGVLYEFYCADGRVSAGNLLKKGYGTMPALFEREEQNIRDYAVTAAVIMDMLLSKSKKMPANAHNNGISHS